MNNAAVIESAAEALGMVRGPQRRMDSINTVQFSGNGTMSVPQSDGPPLNYEITETTLGISYSIPAMRWDLTRVGPDGDAQRRIQVVRGDRAWNERLPGVDPTPVEDQVSRRLRRIWLTPHGIVRAAVDNPSAASVGSRDGNRTLTVIIDGTPVTATLDGDFRPERVEMVIEHQVLGATLLEVSYSDYIDWPKLDVYFPSRIVQTIGGETTLDLTVTDFFQNPYVVFPTPEQLNRSPQ